MGVTVNQFGLSKPLKPNLFSDIASEIAQEVYFQGCKDKYGNPVYNRQNKLELQKNKSTQLRRFYDELVLWYEKVHFERTPKERAAKYDEVEPFIQMLVAKVAYAKGREHVDECFEKMYAHLIRQITDSESLKHAKLFMEAFMGFYKAQEK